MINLMNAIHFRLSFFPQIALAIGLPTSSIGAMLVQFIQGKKRESASLKDSNPWLMWRTVGPWRHDGRAVGLCIDDIDLVNMNLSKVLFFSALQN